jgi:undecaprenyl-diphosphatase
VRVTDQPPDPLIVPAQMPVARPIDQALRILTRTADHGRLWMGVAAVGALAGRRTRRGAIRGLASLGAASFVSNVLLKPLFGRRRPDPERTSVARQIGELPWTSSFPSGHSASAGAFATGATLEVPWAGPILVPLAAAVAYSRVHVGVHYRSDAWVGAAVGITVALIGRAMWPVKPWGPALTAAGTAPALPAGEGLTVILNAASGSSDGAADSIAKALPRARIMEWEPGSDIEDLVEKMPQAFGVAGGDGTVAAVAQLAHRHGRPLAVFPAGTFNHFAKALGLDTDAHTVAAVENGVAGAVDLATIDGVAFLNTSSIGHYPEMVRRRDKFARRMGKWPATAYAILRTLRHEQPIDLVINGEKHPIWIVFIGNGRYVPRGLAPAWRDQLAGGVLDVQYLRADRRFSRTRAILYSIIGVARLSKVYGELETAHVRIESLSGPRPVAHDGEITDPKDVVELAISDRRLIVYRSRS